MNRQDLRAGRIMRKGIVIALVAMVLAGAGMIAGLGLSAPFASVAFAAEPIKVGVIGPFQIDHGVFIREAVQMAADEINAKGGILGRKIELYYADDENSAVKGNAALRKLLALDNVDFIVGGFSSGVVSGIFDVMAQYQKIWLGTGAASSVIIERIRNNYHQYKYYFRVGTLGADYQADAIADFIVDVLSKKHGLTRAAILSTNVKYAQDISEAVKEKIEKAGLKVVYKEYFNPDTTDFSPNFTKAQNSGAQFIVNVVPGNEGITYVKQWNDKKVPLPIVGAIALALKDEFFQETDGKSLFEASSSPNSGPARITPNTLDFVARFKARYKHSPGYIAYPAYDTLYVLKDAAERARSLETEPLIAALEKTDFVGVAPIAFTKDHDLKYGGKYAKFVWYQFQEGGKRVAVYPQEYATGVYVLPSWMK